LARVRAVAACARTGGATSDVNGLTRFGRAPDKRRAEYTSTCTARRRTRGRHRWTAAATRLARPCMRWRRTTSGGNTTRPKARRRCRGSSRGPTRPGFSPSTPRSHATSVTPIRPSPTRCGPKSRRPWSVHPADSRGGRDTRRRDILSSAGQRRVLHLTDRPHRDDLHAMSRRDLTQ